MNKIFCVIVIALCAPQVFAESVTLSLDHPSQSLQFSNNEYEAEYETYEYETTCYGQRTVEDPPTCTTTTTQSCTYEPTSTGGTTVNCTTTPHETCETHGHSETYDYPCTQEGRREVGQTLVHIIHSEVEVALEASDVFKGKQLTVGMIQNNVGDFFPFLEAPFNEAALSYQKVIESQSQHGMHINRKIKITVRAQILDAALQRMQNAQISEMHIGAGTVDLYIKDGAALHQVMSLNLNIVKDRPVLSDQQLFNGPVGENAITQKVQGNDLMVSIDLSKLNVRLSGKKFQVSTSVKFNQAIQIMNRDAFEFAFKKVLTKQI